MKVLTALVVYIALGVACSSGDDSELRDAPIESVDVVMTGTDPSRYAVDVVAQIPGSSCHRPQEPTVRRDGTTFQVTVQNLFTGADVCTADLGYRELTVHLPGDFEAGTEYTVRINDEPPLTFTVR